MDYQTPQSQPVEVFGDQHAKDTRSYDDPAYRRTIHTQEVTFECVHCGQVVTQQRYPSPLMAWKHGYCSDECKRAAGAERAKIRMRAMRERRKAQAQALVTVSSESSEQAAPTHVTGTCTISEHPSVTLSSTISEPKRKREGRKKKPPVTPSSTISEQEG